MSRSATALKEESGQAASGEGRWAIVRFRGSAAFAHEALLEVAEGVRHALRMIGVTDVSIEVEPDTPSAE